MDELWHKTGINAHSQFGLNYRLSFAIAPNQSQHANSLNYIKKNFKVYQRFIYVNHAEAKSHVVIQVVTMHTLRCRTGDTQSSPLFENQFIFQTDTLTPVPWLCQDS